MKVLRIGPRAFSASIFEEKVLVYTSASFGTSRARNSLKFEASHSSHFLIYESLGEAEKLKMIRKNPKERNKTPCPILGSL
jgi:hypothetical protein